MICSRTYTHISMVFSSQLDQTSVGVLIASICCTLCNDGILRRKDIVSPYLLSASFHSALFAPPHPLHPQSLRCCILFVLSLFSVMKAFFIFRGWYRPVNIPPHTHTHTHICMYTLYLSLELYNYQYDPPSWKKSMAYAHHEGLPWRLSINGTATIHSIL